MNALVQDGDGGAHVRRGHAVQKRFLVEAEAALLAELSQGGRSTFQVYFIDHAGASRRAGSPALEGRPALVVLESPGWNGCGAAPQWRLLGQRPPVAESTSACAKSRARSSG